MFYDVPDVRRQVNIKFANFSYGREYFADVDSLRDRGKMDENTWWIVHGAHVPILQGTWTIMFFFLLWKELKYLLFYTFFEKE